MARPFYTQEQVEEGRARLAAAALKLYREHGYSAVTLKQVGAEVGVSSATPYRFFESKEALFERVRADVYRSFGEHLQRCDPKRGDAFLRLRRIARGIFEFGLNHPQDYRLIFSMRQPAVAPGELLFQERQRTIDHVLPICEEVIASRRMRGNALAQLHLAWAAIHGLISFHLTGNLVHGCELEDLIEPMLDRVFTPAGATPTVQGAARAARRQPSPTRSSRR